MFKFTLFCIVSLCTLAFGTICSAIIPPNALIQSKLALGQQLMVQIKAEQNNIQAFNKIYSGKITVEEVLDVLNQYNNALKGPSRFDDYLHGNKNALTPEEIKGYQLFQSYGCAACHNGPNLGGTQFKKMGQAKNYFIAHKTLITPADLGLFEITKQTKDMNVFKVPSLRNVALNYPYYHDASIVSLYDAVYSMGKYQLGVEIPDQDVKALVIFLQSLTAKSLEKTKTN